MYYFQGEGTSNNVFILLGVSPGSLERWYLSAASWNLSSPEREKSINMAWHVGNTQWVLQQHSVQCSSKCVMRFLGVSLGLLKEVGGEWWEVRALSHQIILQTMIDLGLSKLSQNRELSTGNLSELALCDTNQSRQLNRKETMKKSPPKTAVIPGWLWTCLSCTLWRITLGALYWGGNGPHLNSVVKSQNK